MIADGEGRRYALLQAAKDSDYVKKLYGGYFNVYVEAFSEEGEIWDLFRVYEGDFPDFNELHKYDGFVITGSSNDAFGNDCWILKLCFMLQTLDAMEKKILGICFGHQVLCRALGGRVGRANTGWDIGIRQVSFVKDVAPCSYLEFQEIPASISIIEVHQDEVFEIPQGGEVIAFSDKTGVEIFAISGHILGIQGHPEYTKDILFNLIDRLLNVDAIEKRFAEDVKCRLQLAEPDRKCWEKLSRRLRRGGSKLGADLADLKESLVSSPETKSEGDKMKRQFRSGSIAAKRKRFEKRLVKYEDLPEYLKDSEFILDYYRSEWPLKEALWSIFSWHNETLNVWTHLGGFLIFGAIAVMSSTAMVQLWNLLRAQVAFGLFAAANEIKGSDSDAFWDLHLRHILDPSILHEIRESGAETIPRWPWFVYLAGGMGCLACSSISHLLACHSEGFNLFFRRLDYAGISLMIVCSFFAPIYYAFFCNPYARLFYLTSISVLGVLSIITILAPSLSTPRFRPLRASLFLLMGFSGVIPATHALALHWGQPHIFVAFVYELAMAFLYATGTGFYIARIPERWKPGAFDIAGQSHQIFHVFVVLAALAHGVATLVMLDFRLGSPTCAF